MRLHALVPVRPADAVRGLEDQPLTLCWGQRVSPCTSSVQSLCEQTLGALGISCPLSSAVEAPSILGMRTSIASLVSVCDPALEDVPPPPVADYIQLCAVSTLTTNGGHQQYSSSVVGPAHWVRVPVRWALRGALRGGRLEIKVSASS